jgi:hypothetical protein
MRRNRTYAHRAQQLEVTWTVTDVIDGVQAPLRVYNPHCSCGADLYQICNRLLQLHAYSDHRGDTEEHASGVADGSMLLWREMTTQRTVRNKALTLLSQCGCRSKHKRGQQTERSDGITTLASTQRHPQHHAILCCSH